MAKYFDKFPVVSYNGTVAKNILSRVDFTAQTKKDIYSKFDYTISENMIRPDQLSSNYYGSPYYDWVIYMTNNMIDPYYDRYLSEEELRQHVISKYGSLELAYNNILFYRNNWAIDESEIPVSIYDDLDPEIKQYYKPKINSFNQIMNYVRHNQDWIKSTNMIIELTVTSDVFEQFSINDKLIDNSSQASGYVIQTYSDISNEVYILTLQHITGEFQTNTKILNVNILSQVIPDAEASFWAPVNAYEYESEKNALKKYISMIKSSYLPTIDRLFVQQINQ